MPKKILEIEQCNQCPNCVFDVDSGSAEFWGKFYCNNIKKIVDPEDEIPKDCPLPNYDDYIHFHL